MEEKRKPGRPRSVIKLHKRTVSFPPSLYERLEDIAVQDERNVNELIVAVLRDFVRKRETGQEQGPLVPELREAA